MQEQTRDCCPNFSLAVVPLTAPGVHGLRGSQPHCAHCIARVEPPHTGGLVIEYGPDERAATRETCTYTRWDTRCKPVLENRDSKQTDSDSPQQRLKPRAQAYSREYLARLQVQTLAVLQKSQAVCSMAIFLCSAGQERRSRKSLAAMPL